MKLSATECFIMLVVLGMLGMMIYHSVQIAAIQHELKQRALGATPNAFPNRGLR